MRATCDLGLGPGRAVAVPARDARQAPPDTGFLLQDSYEGYDAPHSCYTL